MTKLTDRVTITGKAVHPMDDGGDIIDVNHDHREGTLTIQIRGTDDYVDIPVADWPLVRAAADEVVGQNTVEAHYQYCTCDGQTASLTGSSICLTCGLPKA